MHENLDENIEDLASSHRNGLGYSLLAGLVVSSLLAFTWPADSWGWDPFVLPVEALWGLVALTMYGLGVVVTRAELTELRERPAVVLLGVVVQLTLMPALAWLVVRVLSLPSEVAWGVILVGCVPGAMASNVLTMTAGGHVSYSVSLTTVATLLSPLSVPLAIRITMGDEAEVSMPFLKTSVVLIATVVMPVLLGHLTRRWLGPRVTWMERWAPRVASVALLWIIASVVAGNRDRLTQITGTLLAALLVMNLLGYLGGFLVGRLARLARPMNRALALEVGMQNAGLGTALAATLVGSNSAAQIPTAAYTFGCMLTGTLLAAWWSRSACRVD